MPLSYHLHLVSTKNIHGIGGLNVSHFSLAHISQCPTYACAQICRGSKPSERPTKRKGERRKRVVTLKLHCLIADNFRDRPLTYLYREWMPSDVKCCFISFFSLYCSSLIGLWVELRTEKSPVHSTIVWVSTWLLYLRNRYVPYYSNNDFTNAPNTFFFSNLSTLQSHHLLASKREGFLEMSFSQCLSLSLKFSSLGKLFLRLTFLNQVQVTALMHPCAAKPQK